MTDPIARDELLTQEWLTEALRANGHLERGGVTGVAATTFTTLFSRFRRLELTYSHDASPALPATMLLKTPLPGEASSAMGRDEVAVYRALAGAMPDPPVPRCFDAAVSPETGSSHLLLEDLSGTHFQPEVPLPVSRRHCELCMEALARFHAFWWEHPGLGTSIGRVLDESALDEIGGRTEAALSGFVDFLGDRLSPKRRRIFEAALASLRVYWGRRLVSVERNTLIHGDAHLWNFMHPRDAEGGRAYLIDLATCNRVRPATNDLAYMMAVQWFRERRALMEEALLRRHHVALCSHGVRGYGWDEYRLDYRRSVVTHLFTPVVQWASGEVPAIVWWNNLERIFEAFDDLECAELL